MALGDTSTLSYIMATVYSQEKYIAPHERQKARFWDAAQDLKDGGEITGSGFKFVIETKGSHANGAVAESGDLPTYVAPAGLVAEVDNVQWASSLSFSEYALRVIKGKGVIGARSVIADGVRRLMKEHGMLMNRLSLGASTARLAVVQTTTDTLTTFVCRKPEHTRQLREGMRIDLVDSSGVKQGATETIDTINHETATVTIGNARTLTAGWGVVQADNTLLGMSGLRGTVDDGTYQSVIYGLTKSSDVEVKGQVLDAASGTQSISEQLIRKACSRIEDLIDIGPDVAWCNQSVVNAYLDQLTPSRLFSQSGAGVPNYDTGNKARLGFTYNGKFVPFEIDRDLPVREMFLFPKELWRKHITAKTNWVGDGSGEDGSSSPQFLQATASSGTGYSLAKHGGVYGAGALANLQPKGTLAIRSIAVSDYGD